MQREPEILPEIKTQKIKECLPDLEGNERVRLGPVRIRGDLAQTWGTCSLGKEAGEEEDSACAKVPFRREPGPLPVFAAPGASPLFLLRRNGVEQVRNPFLHLLTEVACPRRHLEAKLSPPPPSWL